jgi:hypothetical protein
MKFIVLLGNVIRFDSEDRDQGLPANSLITGRHQMKITSSPEHFETSSRDLDGTHSCDVEEFVNDLATCTGLILDSCHSFSYSSSWLYSSSPSIRFHIRRDAIQREKAAAILFLKLHALAPFSSRSSSHPLFSRISHCLANFIA